jgi:hypothetical protein
MMNISNELADRRGSSPTAEIATKHVVSKSSSGFIELLPFSGRYLVKLHRSG